MVERCLFAEVACESVVGENDAMVGGFGSLACDAASTSLLEMEGCDIRSSQGVSFKPLLLVCELWW